MKTTSILVRAQHGPGSQRGRLEWGFRESQKEDRPLLLTPGRSIEAHVLTS